MMAQSTLVRRGHFSLVSSNLSQNHDKQKHNHKSGWRQVRNARAQIDINNSFRKGVEDEPKEETYQGVNYNNN